MMDIVMTKDILAITTVSTTRLNNQYHIITGREVALDVELDSSDRMSFGINVNRAVTINLEDGASNGVWI